MYAILTLSALAPVYLSGSELNIKLSFIIMVLYSDLVLPNGLERFSLRRRSHGIVGTGGVTGSGPGSASHCRTPFANSF